MKGARIKSRTDGRQRNGETRIYLGPTHKNISSDGDMSDYRGGLHFFVKIYPTTEIADSSVVNTRTPLQH